MPMYLEMEFDNFYDQKAIQVRILSESFFPKLNKERETKEGQNVGDILNKVVGSLPKMLQQLSRLG